jgi:hypothetical protein
MSVPDYYYRSASWVCTDLDIYLFCENSYTVRRGVDPDYFNICRYSESSIPLNTILDCPCNSYIYFIFCGIMNEYSFILFLYHPQHSLSSINSVNIEYVMLVDCFIYIFYICIKLEKKYAPALDNYGQSCFVRSDF